MPKSCWRAATGWCCAPPRRPGRSQPCWRSLNRLGEAYYLSCDISRPEDRDNLLDQVLERFGRLDVLVNNAGVACKQRLSILETTPESFEGLMKVNCEGTFFLCQGAPTG